MHTQVILTHQTIVDVDETPIEVADAFHLAVRERSPTFELTQQGRSVFINPDSFIAVASL
jgi:hypothetical protein